MIMKILHFTFLILIIYINSVSCVSNSTVVAMKDGILNFNKAGNDFFNLIISKFDLNKVNINDFKDFSLSLTLLNKAFKYYLGYSILFLIGVIFATLMPLLGLIILCCRCFGKCGGKIKVMDPQYVKCKRIIYGLILCVLTTAMLFGVIITLFNNQIVHEMIINEDKSVNIFSSLKSEFQVINQALIKIKDSVNKSQSLEVDNHAFQGFYNVLNDNIQLFYTRLENAPEVQSLVNQSKSLKKVLDRLDITKNQSFIQDLNNQLSKLRNNMKVVKATIIDRLVTCTTHECSVVRNKTESLGLVLIDQTIIDTINNTLNQLKNIPLQMVLRKVLELRENNAVNMKFMLDKEFKNLNNTIGKKENTKSIKQGLLIMISKIVELEESVEINIFSPVPEDSRQHESYKIIKAIETYRFYCYIIICFIILVIIICYYMGLVFGTFGTRPIEDASCYNRRVGARFLKSAIVLTFLFSSIFMTCVIANMMTSGVVQTEICRYSGLANESDIKVLDFYLRMVFNVSSDYMDLILNKCYNKNVYEAFSEMNQRIILKNFETFSLNIDKEVTTLVSSQMNITELSKIHPLKAGLPETIRYIGSSIGLLKNEKDVLDYIGRLELVISPKDIEQVRVLNGKVHKLRNKFNQIIENLNDSEGEYVRWRTVAQLLDNNTSNILRSKLPELLSSLRKQYLGIINGFFNKIFEAVSCKNLRTGVVGLFKSVCDDFVTPLNGVWYGIGFVLLLVIPTVFFACLLAGLYGRIQKFYPDREEPDYDNYIGFYARADGEAFRSYNAAKKSVHRGYKPISLHNM